jgi:hypothetical protein
VGAAAHEGQQNIVAGHNSVGEFATGPRQHIEVVRTHAQEAPKEDAMWFPALIHHLTSSTTVSGYLTTSHSTIPTRPKRITIRFGPSRLSSLGAPSSFGKMFQQLQIALVERHIRKLLGVLSSYKC